MHEISYQPKQKRATNDTTAGSARRAQASARAAKAAAGHRDRLGFHLRPGTPCGFRNRWNLRLRGRASKPCLLGVSGRDHPEVVSVIRNCIHCRYLEHTSPTQVAWRCKWHCEQKGGLVWRCHVLPETPACTQFKPREVRNGAVDAAAAGAVQAPVLVPA